MGLILILGYMDFRKYKGEIFLWYTAWYGIGRAWMEPLRDTSYNLHIFGVRINMLLAIVAAVVAIGCIILLHLRKPEKLMTGAGRALKNVPESDYEAQFSYAAEAADIPEEPESEEAEDIAEDLPEAGEEQKAERGPDTDPESKKETEERE